MKKTILFITALAFLASCKPESKKDYVTLSGKITNPNEDLTLLIRQLPEYKKTIKINEDGTFNDTLKIPKNGKCFLLHNKESAVLFLENGDEISFTLDTEEFDETLKFEGDNAEKSNFIVANYLLNETILDMSSIEDEESLLVNYKKYEEAYAKLKEEYNLDTSFTNPIDEEIEISKLEIVKSIKERAEMIATMSGNPSPVFGNYENYDGTTTSLSDLKGKYVYVDVWATWCGPCKAEIPHLKTIEEKYHGKNIEFVSISVDEDKDKEKWKTMIKDKEMAGIQLFADNNWGSDFVTAYKINGIPRFILIDPSGNTVTPDAPRPSDEKLVELLDAELN